MTNNFVRQGNLSDDAIFDNVAKKIHFESVITGTGSPVTPPSLTAKRWLYVDRSLTPAILWLWDPSVATWVQVAEGAGAVADLAATLATVATSGDYDDLVNRPTIPDTSNLVEDTDPRLSDARTPLTHTHPATEVSTSPATTGLDPASTDVEKALTELAARPSGGSAGSVAGSPTAYSGFFVPPGRFQYGDASLVSVSNGTTYYTLGLTPHDITLTAARSRITTAAAATVLRRFVCTADASLMPDEMLWQETVDGATTGLRDTTGLAVKIPAGWYLIGCRPEGGNLTIVTVGQIAPSARSNIAVGQSDPGDGMIAAGSGSGVITTPPIPTAIWATNSINGGSPISMRWSA